MCVPHLAVHLCPAACSAAPWQRAPTRSPWRLSGVGSGCVRVSHPPGPPADPALGGRSRSARWPGSSPHCQGPTANTPPTGRTEHYKTSTDPEVMHARTPSLRENTNNICCVCVCFIHVYVCVCVVHVYVCVRAFITLGSSQLPFRPMPQLSTKVLYTSMMS